MHRICLAALLVLPTLAMVATAQEDALSKTPQPSFMDRVWLSGQANFVFQGHPSFRSPYSGPNSFASSEGWKNSRVLTLFAGLKLNDSTEFLFDVEETSGSNLSGVVGLAGFTDADVTGVPNARPYVARAMIHHIIALSHERVETNQGPLQISKSEPVRHVEIYLGKMSLLDFFDVNAIGSDTHFQFLNWALDNNGAYGYPADVRGYTYAALFEYQEKNWAARFAESLVPKLDSPSHVDANLTRARQESYELEWRRSLLPKRQTIIRPLAFVSHGTRGNYQDALNYYRAGVDSVPDVTLHRKANRMRYGFGVNTEQELTDSLRVFARYGWSEGENEATAFTEVNSTISVGVDQKGDRWHRKDDKVGLAVLSNGLSKDHRTYLASGGLGLLLGDGALNYGREQTIEAYYSAKLYRFVYGSIDLQRIWNPGYNRDRGPVFVASFRLHLESNPFHMPK